MVITRCNVTYVAAGSSSLCLCSLAETPRAAQAAAREDILLEMTGISKGFPGVLALDDVDFDLRLDLGGHPGLLASGAGHVRWRGVRGGQR